MGNHVHLLLTASRMAGAVELMDAVRKEFGCGVLPVEQTGDSTVAPARLSLEESCTASPIHTARHLLACMRYIELNPVHAGLVRRPEDFPWSSYAANAEGREDALLSPHPHYLALGRDPEQRCAAYRRSVDASLRRDRSSGL
jgi:putative transposase